MSIIKTFGVAAAVFAAFVAPAFANSLTIGGGVASVSCSPSCAGIVGGSITFSPSLGVTGGTAGSLSNTAADLYGFSPSNAAEEAKALNVLAGTNFSTGTQTDTGSASSFSFSTVASWIALKIGNQHFFLQNTAGPVTLFINYLKASGPAGAGGGLSHYTEFGNVVPVPGAIWLMGAGLAGLGFAQRRKKA